MISIAESLVLFFVFLLSCYLPNNEGESFIMFFSVFCVDFVVFCAVLRLLDVWGLAFFV